MAPRNILSLQRTAAFVQRLGEIDAAITVLHAEGYGDDADRLLDERTELVEAHRVAELEERKR
jgi:hypothetical protein